MDCRRRFGLLGAANPVAVAELDPDGRRRKERTLRRGEETHRPVAGAFYFGPAVRMCGFGDDSVVCRNSHGGAVVAELAHHAAPAVEVDRKQRRDCPGSATCAKRRELGRKTIGLDLKQALGPRYVLQKMVAEIAEPDLQ